MCLEDGHFILGGTFCVYIYSHNFHMGKLYGILGAPISHLLVMKTPTADGVGLPGVDVLRHPR